MLKRGLCHRCGACVAFCAAINYGALEFTSEGHPRQADKDKCNEGGLCYAICPAIDELKEETRINLSDAVRICLGLFCAGNFIFGDTQRRKVAQIGDFRWERVNKINIKKNLMVHLDGGEVREIELTDLNFMKRYACNYCNDFAADYADISFGGLGADEGWTTVVIRSAPGKKIIVCGGLRGSAAN